MSTDECDIEFQSWLAKYGRSRCDRIMRAHLKARLEVPGRPRQKRYSWGEYQRIYKEQGGRCPICKQTMALIKGLVEMDHINPNLTGPEFEARSNRRVCCRGCNRSKGAKSIPAQAKHYGKTMSELLGDEP